MDTKSTQFYVAGDIGGTYTRFALLTADSNGFHPVTSVRLKTAEVESLERALEDSISTFKTKHGADRISGICLSPAGPVENNVCRLTNVKWTIDGNELERALGIPTLVVNDFTAVCYGVPLLSTESRDQLVRISESDGDPAQEDKTGAVVGAGTGLGVGFLHWNGRWTRAYPSEAGHADFAPFDGESERLWNFLRDRIGAAPDAEQFISGQGLANIADFAHSRSPRSSALAEIAGAKRTEKPSMLAQAALEDDECAAAMRLFVKMYGRYCGNIGLHFLPQSGLFLAGGIVSKNLRWFEEEPVFMDAFHDHYLASLRSILKKMPVYAITEPAVSYIGAARAVVSERLGGPDR